MVRYIILAILSSVLLSSCAQQNFQPTGPTREEAAANRAKPFIEGQAALARYAASSGCQNTDALTITQNIEELQRLVRTFHGWDSMYRQERNARQRHTELSFDYADQALEKGCLDEAERVYRELVSFYVGSLYSGIRDRARIGIDDVRAARAAHDY